MKKTCILLIFAICVALGIHAQSVVPTFTNAHPGMRASLSLSGLTPGRRVIVTLPVSNNLSGLPVIGYRRDSFYASAATASVVYTVSVTGISYPQNVYVFPNISVRDTATGTLTAVPMASPALVGITPAFTLPTITFGTPISDSTSGKLPIIVETGNDTGRVKIYLSLNNSDCSSMFWVFPAAERLYNPVYGMADQRIYDTIPFPIGVTDIDYSGEAVVVTSFGTDMSACFNGHTGSSHPTLGGDTMMVALDSSRRTSATTAKLFFRIYMNAGDTIDNLVLTVAKRSNHGEVMTGGVLPIPAAFYPGSANVTMDISNASGILNNVDYDWTLAGTTYRAKAKPLWGPLSGTFKFASSVGIENTIIGTKMSGTAHVYDMLGHEVHTLHVDDVDQPVVLPSDVAPGMYAVRMITDQGDALPARLQTVVK